jgi:hypothetical protein
MFKSPIVLGIDSQRPREIDANVERVLSWFGNNTGNLVFSEALYRVLGNARRSSYHFDQKELEGRDVIVVAAANWLNPYSDFSDLAQRLEQTKLPVIICGLGAQAALSKQIPKLQEGTLRLIQLAAERSASLSTRGDFTCEVLASYGIKNSVSTGCPSLMLCGPEPPQIRRPAQIEVRHTCIHSTRHLLNLADKFQLYLYKEAYRLNIDIVLQSELADFYCAINTPPQEGSLDKVNAVLAAAYGAARAEEVKTYLGLKGKVFFSMEDWIAYMKTKVFCLGTRIHGTIMSLIAGTPALLIAHDSRTLEMAQKMNIPHIESAEVDIAKQIDIPRYYDNAKLDRFVDGFPAYYRGFMEFFSANGLAVNSEYLSPLTDAHAS